MPRDLKPCHFVCEVYNVLKTWSESECRAYTRIERVVTMSAIAKLLWVMCVVVVVVISRTHAFAGKT